MAIAQPRLELGVEARKKTTKTTASQSTSYYVDRVSLDVTLTALGESTHAELVCYFVGRNIQTQALGYFGFERQPITLSRTRKTIQVESQPFPYNEHKAARSTADRKSGSLPWGWVVLVVSNGEEVAVKASSPEVLQWVRKNPPRGRTPNSR